VLKTVGSSQLALRSVRHFITLKELGTWLATLLAWRSKTARYRGRSLAWTGLTTSRSAHRNVDTLLCLEPHALPELDLDLNRLGLQRFTTDVLRMSAVGLRGSHLVFTFHVHRSQLNLEIACRACSR